MQAVHVHSASPEMTPELVFQSPYSRSHHEDEFSIMLSEPEGDSTVRTSSMQELLSTMSNQAIAPLSKSSGRAIPADAYEATGSSMDWEGRHGPTDVAEHFIDLSSFITTSDDDVLNNGAYMTWMSETEAPLAGYIMGLTEDSSRPSELPQLQLPVTELVTYLTDSFLNGVGEPSDGYYHG
jgi:hypothetical protein